MKAFTIYIISISFIVIGSIVAFNYTVDAFGIFNPDDKTKYDVTGFLRTIKPFWIKEGNYDGIIVGTSRAHNGFDPEKLESVSPIKYFNYGQSALSYVGANSIIKYAIKEDIQNYIILLDSYLLPNKVQKLNTRNPQWLPNKSDPQQYKNFFVKETLPNLITPRAIRKSFNKILGNEEDAVWKTNGHNTLGSDRFLGGKRLVGPLRINLVKGKGRNFGDHRFEVFKTSFDALCECTGKVRFVFPPVSMYYLSAIEHFNYGVTDDFKTKVSKYILDNKATCKGEIILVDYMYVNEITTEDLTVPKMESEFYRDPGHFRATLGTMMVNEMESGNYKYGIQLTEKNYKFQIKNSSNTFADFHNNIGVPLMKSHNLIDSSGQLIKKVRRADRKE